MRDGMIGGLVAILLLGLASIVQAATATVDVDQAKGLIESRDGKPELVVLDVRTRQEFAEGHLPGAVNLDVQAPDFERQLTALDRGKTYLVYCRTGARSSRAVRAMEQLGFQSIQHMSQGIVRWQERHFPIATGS